MADIVRRYTGGYVDSRDRSDLAPDECQANSGAWYRPGDPDPWKFDGRSVVGISPTSLAIRGLALCQFEGGVGDLLIALSGTDLYSKDPTPSDDMSMDSLAGNALSAASTHLSNAFYSGHGGEHYYLCTGVENKVLKTDGTLREMGMVRPQQAPTLTLNTVVSTPVRPTASDGTFTDSANAYDTGTTKFDTFAFKTYKNAPGSSTVIVYQGFGANADTARKLIVRKSVV